MNRGRKLQDRVFLASLAIALLLISTFAARAAEPLTEIPYVITKEGWIKVPVRVNSGGPYQFLLDTASTVTVVYEKLAVDQGFQPAGRAPFRVRGLKETRMMPAFFLGDFEIGGQRIDNHAGVILPDWPEEALESPDGILGLDFLTRYRVEFNTAQQVIKLYDPHTMYSPSRKWTSARMRAESFGEDNAPLFISTAQISGRRIHCLVDFGATRSLINYPALRSLRSGYFVQHGNRDDAWGGARMNDVFGNESIIRNARFSSVGLGRKNWVRRVMLVFNADLFRELGVNHRPYCILGADLLGEQDVILDFLHETIYVYRK